MSTFLLLLGFALFKVTIGIVLVYLGFRGHARDEPDDGFGRIDPEPPPRLPTRRSRSARRRTVRGHAWRTPPRRHVRPVRAGR